MAFVTIDDYIDAYPEEVQTILQEIRRRVRKAAPTAEETISYKIPTFTLNGKYLVYFAAWKHHIAFYPIARAEGSLEKDLAPYRSGKDTLKFPLNKPIPYDLIDRLVAFLVKRRTAGSH